MVEFTYTIEINDIHRVEQEKMNVDKLSKRLERVSTYIPAEAILADIGSDHAYLPCYAIKEGIASRAIAGEVVEGPFQSAIAQVKETGLEEQIAVRKGNGLEVLAPGEAQAITICGMGGSLITRILDEGKEKLSGQERLILQPNIGAQFIRAWLLDEGWELTAEEILEEDGKIYEILVAQKGESRKPYADLNTESAILMGPYLLKEQNDVFKKKWNQELTHWRKIVQQVEESGNERSLEKKEELTRLIEIVEEALER